MGTDKAGAARDEETVGGSRHSFRNYSFHALLRGGVGSPRLLFVRILHVWLPRFVSCERRPRLGIPVGWTRRPLHQKQQYRSSCNTPVFSGRFLNVRELPANIG